MKEKGTKKEEGRNSEGKPRQGEGAESEKEGFEKTMKLLGAEQILIYRHLAH
jgi:hypothetical protein